MTNALSIQMVRDLRRLGLEPGTQACINCAHFYQHYNRDGERIYCGTCCYPRLKPRKVYDSCGRFCSRYVNDM